jgi:hypothetical protein
MKAFPNVFLDYIPKEEYRGMDLRDYFAARAMQEFISEMPLVWSENTIIDINIARVSYLQVFNSDYIVFNS